jgi:hypothetical protein
MRFIGKGFEPKNVKAFKKQKKLPKNNGFPKTSVFGKATLNSAVLQGFSLKNCKSLSQNHAL